MKRILVLLSLVFHPAVSAPALVWRNNEQTTRTLHHSEEISASSVLGDLPPKDASSGLASVVFLLGRNADGSERLSQLAAQGDLPTLAANYETASAIHHNVVGIDSTRSIVSKVSGHSVAEVTLDEFSRKLESLTSKPAAEVEVSGDGQMTIPTTTTSKSAGKRARALAKASVLVVKVDGSTDPSVIDAAVASAMENRQVIDNVVVAGMRSTEEVKHERKQFYRRRLEAMHDAGRKLLSRQQQQSRHRRLEDEQEGEQNQNENNNNNGNGDDDMSGTYYVHLTPNILSGLLVILLFIVTTCIGVTCMGNISGQDVYVNKMPAIGREA